jgi:hypothetical protein
MAVLSMKEKAKRRGVVGGNRGRKEKEGGEGTIFAVG